MTSPAGPRDAAKPRAAMVAALVADGELTDPAWRAAFAAVPRHLLVSRFYAQPGYTAALLSHRLGDHAVTSIGIDPYLCAAAWQRLATAGPPGSRRPRTGGKILAAVASGLALLDVGPDRAATGRFLSGAYFMPLRQTAAPNLTSPSPPPPEPTGLPRETDLPSTAVYDGPFRFHLSIACPA
ncbi:MAG TPA: hypothetical protein VLJ59_07560 [Mycobacteriales bacterium]|nr:hypothetical protein [Mycobacteriales bacterium]